MIELTLQEKVGGAISALAFAGLAWLILRVVRDLRRKNGITVPEEEPRG